eukprot:jgi/Pico_ML_1/54587/g484.t1
MLDAEDKETCAGALDTVYKLCEDAPAELEKPVRGLGDWPLNLFVPRLMAKFGSPEAEFRRDALACVNLVVGYMPSALQLNLDLYLQGLFALAKDADNEVRKNVCNGLVQLMEVQPDKLMPFMKDVIEYMLGSTQESDASIALESWGGGRRDEDEEEGFRSWNLRKSSAAGLDVLSNVFGDDLLPVMMPIVEQMMQQNDWRCSWSVGKTQLEGTKQMLIIYLVH